MWFRWLCLPIGWAMTLAQTSRIMVWPARTAPDGGSMLLHRYGGRFRFSCLMSACDTKAKTPFGASA
jgi:hypothetical protein